MSRRILLTEDDVNLGSLLRNYLSAKNYETTLFGNGHSALNSYKAGTYDLCILDIMMPEMDGLSLAKGIRKLDPAVPIIFLTAKTLQEDIIEGFKTGADDYITKPFSMEELIYRIEAILRRIIVSEESQADAVPRIGQYTFDNKRQILAIGSYSISLTTKESELLGLLYHHKNEVLERNYALRSIWIDDNYFNARSMDVYITRLRKYLKKDPAVRILNIHGRGYRLIC
ncbi:MAG: response regulator transcription factor [Bacteroidales bacterium]